MNNIGLLVLDVDGVLTDGRFFWDGDFMEIKAFHTADGLGLRLLMDAGVKVAFLTGRDSPFVQRNWKVITPLALQRPGRCPFLDKFWNTCRHGRPIVQGTETAASISSLGSVLACSSSRNRSL